MFNHRVNRLWLRVYLLAGLATLAVGALGLFLSYRFELAELEQAREQRLQRTVDLVAESIAEPLAAGDARAARDALRLAMVGGTIIVASVYRDDQLLTRVGDSDHVSSLQDRTLAVPVRGVDGGTAGRVEIRFRDRMIREQLRERLVGNLAILLLASLGGGVVLLIALRRRVGRPLQRLAQVLRDGGDRPPEPVQDSGGDELGQFVHDFNQRVERVAAADAGRESERRALLASNDEFRNLLAHLPGAVFQTSNTPERRFLYVSRGIQPLTGRRCGELVGAQSCSLAELMCEEDRDPTWNRIQEAIRHHEPYQVEYRLVDTTGQSHWVMEQGMEVVVAGGRPLLEGIITDITERHFADERLKMSATVFESCTEAIMVTRPDGRITAVNQAFSQVTGYASTEVIGRTPAFNKSGWHDASFYRTLWAEIGQYGRWQGEIWNRRKNGEVYPAWLSISAVLSSDGEVASYVANFTDIANLKRSDNRIEDYYYHDALTGLPNRQLFAGRLELAIHRAQRQDRQLAVLVLDLDRFDEFNHRNGAALGDELLRAVAGRLTEVLRRQDSVARLGSDEFAVVVEDLRDAFAAARVAGKLLDMFAQPFRLGGSDHGLKASIGIALYPDDGSHVGSLLQAADSAMYRAKESGPASYQFNSSARQDQADLGGELQAGLAAALREGRIRVYFQPIARLADGKVTGAEALVRWPHDGHGLVGSEQILASAEAAGLLALLGEWVLHRTCMHLADWRDAGAQLETVTVNLAPVQWQGVGLADLLRRVLEETRCPAECLALEIPEAQIMGDRAAVAQLRACAEMGVRLILDQCGSTPCDMDIMSELPFSALKLNRELVAGVPGDESIGRRISTLLALARALQIPCIAVGVETEQQRDWLNAHQCEFGQGLLYGSPVPSQQLAEQLIAPAIDGLPTDA